MGNTITMKRVRLLYAYAMHDLKQEHLNQLNKEIANLTGINIMLIITLIILGLSLKKMVDMSAKI